MYDVIGYLNYKKYISKNIFEKILDKMLFRIKFNYLSQNQVEILINRNRLNEKRIKKIKKAIIDNAIHILVLSNKINDANKLENEDIKILNGKFLMKNIVINILEYIYNCQSKDIRFEEVYVTINNDKHQEILFDLAKKMKCINIVTDKIKKLKRLDKKLENEDDIIYSISNNTKKALKKANIIINFDYDEDFFYKFNVNRKAIIINLSNNKFSLKNSYQGVIIDNIVIDYENDRELKINSGDFDKNILYESKIINLKYQQDNFINDNCKVNYLLGKNGIISVDELKKLIKLDKYIKMD